MTLSQSQAADNRVSRLDMALRLCGFYGGVCLYIGFLTPYWPVWLKAHGMGPTEIAILLATNYAMRILAGPAIGSLADRYGDRRRALILLLAATLVSNALFFLGHGFWTLLAMTAFAALVYPPVLPLMEVVTLQGCERAGLDYARIRVSGSATFMLCSWVVGLWLDEMGTDILLPGMLVMLCVSLYAAFRLPHEAPGPVDPMKIEDAPAADLPSPLNITRGARPVRYLLRNPVFLVFAAAASLIQASHATYYAFGTLNWQMQGYSSAVIGALWALGVISEITLFILSKPIIARLGPAWLLAIGGAAGVLRWSLTALSPPPAITWAVQILHALSFGASHLAAMHFIQRGVPASAAASAQSLYQSLFIGIIFGIVTLGAGPLFAQLGAGLFWLSAGLSALGMALAVALARMWRGGRLELEPA